MIWIFLQISLDSSTILINVFNEPVKMHSEIDSRRYSDAVEFAQN